MAASKPFPKTSLVRRNDTHRFIASKRGESVLGRIADSNRHLVDLFTLDNATNDRLLVEGGIPAGIDSHELVFGIPYYRIVNASFTHPHPLGSRFNGPERGAWYCGFEIETSQAEVAYHKSVDLAEIGVFEDDVTYDDYTADFSAEFHDARDAKRFARYLNPESYVASQKLAEELLSDRVARNRLSERASFRRHVHFLFSAGARHEREEATHLSLCVGWLADARDRASVEKPWRRRSARPSRVVPQSP